MSAAAPADAAAYRWVHPRGAYTASGFFVLRAPALAFDELERWSTGLVAVGVAEEESRARAALESDRRLLRERLQALYARPDLREALFIASPSLFERSDLVAGPADGERGQKLERALVRYFLRMTARPTPFGLFAGCALGAIGPGTELTLGPAAKNRRHTRLDMDYLCALAQALQDPEALGAVLRYRPNSSLYRLGDRWHYAEWRIESAGRTYHLVAVESTPYLEATLARAESGARLDELAGALVADDPEITHDEAHEFLASLVASQILVSEIEPPVTGAEPVNRLLQQLTVTGAAGRVANQLRSASAAIAELDRASGPNDPQRYKAIAAELGELPAKLELSKLFQVDLYRAASMLTLGKSVLDELARGIDLLHRLARSERERVARFRETFTTRYEEREVPLVEALDEERGIGFDLSGSPNTDASPLLAGLAFPSGDADTRVSWTARDAHLLRRLTSVWAAGEGALELSQDDLVVLAAASPAPLPDAFAVVGRLAAESAEAVDRGEFRVLLEYIAGPSGALLLGRFCHGDAPLAAAVRAHLAAEEATRPDAVFAEIVHLPEGRLGNVLLRPVLRGYEIPYLGVSGAAADRQIPVNDLLVSVRGERVVLRSRRLGREVIPRLTSAHNYDRKSLGIYRFLCALQLQGVAVGLTWMWGPLDSAPFLPRVTHGRLVLARARWLLGKRELERLTARSGPALFEAVQQWRAQRRLPRRLVLADSDNELPIDLDNVLCVETLIHELRDRDSALLVEQFPAPEQLAVRSPEGRFSHEFVVPYVRRVAPAVPRPEVQRPAPAIRRRFPPGGEWLYAKLYCGPAQTDRVLGDLVAPLIESLRARGAIDRWFFIRFGDPEWHLRLRLHGDPERLNRQARSELERAAEPLLMSGAVWRMQLDTYERELERYGGDAGMELVEQIFEADSDAVLGIVATLAGDAGAEARWQLALRGADRLLGDLGFDLVQRAGAMKALSASFQREFDVKSALRQQIAGRYREKRAVVDALLATDSDPQHELAPGFELLAQRSARLAPLADELRAAAAAGRLTAELSDLAGSLVHMHVNRLLRSTHRAHELVLYFFLEKAYESRLARRKVD